MVFTDSYKIRHSRVGYSEWGVIRKEFPWIRSRLPTLWTNSYFVSTIGGAPLEPSMLEQIFN